MAVKGADIIVLGVTFKENCRDLRNSKVIDVVRELQSYGCRIHLHDPIAESGACQHEYGIGLTDWDALPKASALVAAVPHKEYLDGGVSRIAEKLLPGAIFADVKSVYDPAAVAGVGARLWRL
jgi:UDP-N-acetyl-D-galactosamine dehydrogenase